MMRIAFIVVALLAVNARIRAEHAT